MNDRRPPGPPPPPRPPVPRPNLESYRPASERPQHPGDPRQWAGAPQPPANSGQRPYPTRNYPDPRMGGPGAPPAPPNQKPPRKRSLLPSGLSLILTLVIMAVLAAGFAVTLLPADFVREKIVALVKERTGRDLVIRGAARFTVYPSVGVTLGDVTLTAPPGMKASAPLVTMQSLEAKVALMPLLKREVIVDTLILTKPLFNLEIDAKGQKTWDFAELLAEPIRLAQGTAPTSDAPGGLPADQATSGKPSAARLQQLKLDDVRIEDGTLIYMDAKSASREEIKALNVSLGLPAISLPMTSKGNFVWRGKKVSIDGTLTSPEALIETRPAKISMALLTDVGQGTFEGSLATADAVSLEGILATKSASLRDLLSWLGTDLPPSKGFGPFEAKGLLRTAPKSVTYSSLEMTLDGATARGQIGLETSGARPLLKANLKITELDLNSYASTGATPQKAAPKAAPAPKATEAQPGGKANSIDDLLDREPAPAAGPRVKGYTQRAGWSEEAYELSPLSLVDAEAKLSVGKLTVREIKVGQTELTVALKNAQMKTTIDDVRLYDGRGRGFITVDASQKKAANVAANLTFEGISAEPFLRDAADFDRISGKGRLALALAGQGANERQIIETLAGKVDFTFADGAVKGLNVAGMMRAAGQGRIADLKTAPTEKTDFSELSSTWNVAAGVAQNQDLKLSSPLLRVTGAGTVTLPARQVDYTVRPKIVSDIAGQGGAQGLSGIEVPVRIHGPWDKPKIAPDLAGVLKNPKAIDTIKEIGKQFKGKNAGEIVDGLLGKGGNAGEATDGKTNAKKLLDQFLNKQ